MSEYHRRRHLTVLDVMTSDVVTARPDEAIKEVAQRLYGTGLSALPIIDDLRRVLGVVSEEDLLVRHAGQPETGVLHPRRSKSETARAVALLARDAMTSPAITISPGAYAAEAARVMHRRKVKHLPVVDAAGKLLGVVSRHDVIKVFTRSDDSIREEVINGVIERDLMIDTAGLDVSVEAGVVSIEGEIERRSNIAVLTFLVSATDGVVGVRNSLTYGWDDTEEAVSVGADLSS